MDVAVIIPCYKVKKHIASVVAGIPPEITRIYAVDDACPEGSGDFIDEHIDDPRLTLLRHEQNKGVGGAIVTGYRAALADGMDVMVKVDGDGQMDPTLIPNFVAPLRAGEADYAKGNRFFSASAVKAMPGLRLFGNAVLSLLTKLSSGYWGLFDPTNGYTAIHRKAVAALDLDGLSERYFFETDMLISLGDVRAVVVDIPMMAVYGDEESNLRISTIVGEFLRKHIRSTIRRIFYMYFVRDFNLASLNLLFGLITFFFGVIFGMAEWIASVSTGVPATTGTVMLAVLPIISGFQMILFFLGFDMSNVPRRPLQQMAVVASLNPPAELPAPAPIPEKESLNG
ncbi:glycosyltransferase family 2 protein [Aliiroseovarius sp. YM-037]|uniref:glycosyltransferase family 2 protein n=1 Tax=Aliiroseovarius sp. YM-037 TaxID=3341728 RepID=UPI003A80F6F2